MIAVKSPPREVLTVKVCNTEDQGFLGHGSLHMGLTSTVLVSASLREVEKTGHSEKSPMDFFPFHSVKFLELLHMCGVVGAL